MLHAHWSHSALSGFSFKLPACQLTISSGLDRKALSFLVYLRATQTSGRVFLPSTGAAPAYLYLGTRTNWYTIPATARQVIIPARAYISARRACA